MNYDEAVKSTWDLEGAAGARFAGNPGMILAWPSRGWGSAIKP
ncbi:hypothetical protein [Halomonas gemina]|nr:hypothetical protein [Halomonas gemina]